MNSRLPLRFAALTPQKKTNSLFCSELLQQLQNHILAYSFFLKISLSCDAVVLAPWPLLAIFFYRSLYTGLPMERCFGICFLILFWILRYEKHFSNLQECWCEGRVEQSDGECCSQGGECRQPGPSAGQGRQASTFLTPGEEGD